MKIVNETTGGLFISFGESECGQIPRGGPPLERKVSDHRTVVITVLDGAPIVYKHVADDETITVLSKREGGE